MSSWISFLKWVSLTFGFSHYRIASKVLYPQLVPLRHYHLFRISFAQSWKMNMNNKIILDNKRMYIYYWHAWFTIILKFFCLISSRSSIMSSIRERFVIKFASWFGCSWSCSLPSSLKEFAWKISPNLWFEMPTTVLTLIFFTGFKFTSFVKASTRIVSLLLSICCWVFVLGLRFPDQVRSPSRVKWGTSSSYPCWQVRWYKLTS